MDTQLEETMEEEDVEESKMVKKT
jgi:hypothetical protein